MYEMVMFFNCFAIGRPKELNGWYFKVPFPHSDIIFNETMGHLGWISCEIHKFPAGNTHRPVGKVRP